MSGWRRRGHASSWQPVTWAEDGRSFKVEQEGVGISDDNIDSWLKALEDELSPWTSDGGITCSSLNLSRNELECRGVQKVVRVFIRLKVPVVLVKLFKNWVADHGMQAIADLIREMPEPVQEIHLSHNLVSSVGALAVLEAVRDTSHYPILRGGHRYPLWLRLENNRINWEAVLPHLDEWELPWASGDTKDAWKSQRKGNGQDACPTVMMHYSYYHQGPRRYPDAEWESWYEGGEAADWVKPGNAKGGKCRSGQPWEDGGNGSAPPARGRGRSGKGKGSSGSGHGPGGDDGWSGWVAEPAEEPGTGEDGAGEYGHLSAEAAAAMARASAAASSIAAAAGAAGEQVSRIEEFIKQELMRSTDEHHAKFKLIFSILDDIKKRQLSLEESVESMASAMHCQQPHMQHMAVAGTGQWQSMPVDAPVGMAPGSVPQPGAAAWNAGAAGMDPHQAHYGHVMW